MALIKKTGEWIMVTRDIGVETPVDPFSIYYAIPTGKYFYKDESHVNGREIFYYDFSEIINLISKVDNFSRKEICVKILKRASKNNFDFEEFNSFEKYIYSILDNKGITLDDFSSQIKIKTIFGDVVLNPEDYNVVENIEKYLAEIDYKTVVMRFLTKSEQLTGKLNDQVFYLRSRGIGFVDSLKMCINNIKTQNLFYLEMTPANAAYFTRNYLNFAKRKERYFVKNNRTDLLEYPEYNLNQFINHLEQC